MPAPISPYGLFQQFVSPFDFTGRTRINQREQMRAMILKDLDIGAQLPEPESTTYFEGAHFVQDVDKIVREDLGAVRFSTSVLIDPDDNEQVQLIRNEDVDLDDRFKPIKIDPESYIVECDPAILIATVPKREGSKKVRSDKLNLRGISAKLPGDHPGIIVRGSEEFSQHLLFHPSFMNVLFASTDGDEGSTLVADLDGGKIDKKRVGGLDTVLRVGPDWKKFCPVALDFTADARSPSLSKGLFSSSGLFGFDQGEPANHAYCGESGGGVNAAGAGQADRHNIGQNKDGEHFAQGHIQANTPIYADPNRDAPREIRLEAYEKSTGKGSVPWEVEMRYDRASSHIGLGKNAIPVNHEGLFRWETFLPLFIVKPPPIPYPPKEKKKPSGKPRPKNPVADPKDPGEGFIPPWFVPLPDSEEVVKRPLDGPDDGPAYDPWKKRVKPITEPPKGEKTERAVFTIPNNSISTEAASSRPMGGGSNIFAETSTTPNNDSVIESKHMAVVIQGIIDPTREFVAERVYFGSPSRAPKKPIPALANRAASQNSRESVIGWATQENRGVTKELIKIDRDQQIKEPRKIRINSTLHAVSEFAAQSIALFPRHICSMTDFRYNPKASPDDLNRALSKTPAVGRIEVLGPQKGSIWDYTSEPGGTSRYNAGTGNGGRWLMPPEYDSDFLQCGTLPSAHSTTYQGFWDSCIAFGTPIVAGSNAGGVSDGFILKKDADGLKFQQHNPAGTAIADQYFNYLEGGDLNLQSNSGVIFAETSSGGDPAVLKLASSNGTLGTPTNSADDDILGKVQFNAYDSFSQEVSYLQSYVEDIAAQAFGLRWGTTDGGTLRTTMTLAATGALSVFGSNIAIGQTGGLVGTILAETSHVGQNTATIQGTSGTLAYLSDTQALTVTASSGVFTGVVGALHLVDTSGGVAACNLPAASASSGRLISVKDKGNAAANNIAINRAGSDTIQGATSTAITSNYGSVRLRSDGVSIWYLVD
jgi:hypothetical protein